MFSLHLLNSMMQMLQLEQRNDIPVNRNLHLRIRCVHLTRKTSEGISRPGKGVGHLLYPPDVIAAGQCRHQKVLERLWVISLLGGVVGDR